MNATVRNRSRLPAFLAALAVAVAVAGVASPARAASGEEVAAPEAYTTLSLINGWSGGPFATRPPKAKVVAGVVYFKGAMATSGSDMRPFVMPVGMRPSKDVYVAVSLCDAENGRLRIQPNGTVTVDPEGAVTAARCFTSLDGASFLLNPSGQTALTLQNGWTGGALGTRSPRAFLDAGVVHLRGAMAGGASAQAFTLPAGLRPSKDVYLQISLCDAANGRLVIEADGDAFVFAESEFADAQCFTSLDGASFSRNPPGQAALPLVNGWVGGPFVTRTPKAVVISGIVHLRGAISTGSTNLAFTLPVGMRPSKDTFVPVDECNVTDGRLVIQTDGDVLVQNEDDFTDAQCFTSLDGAAFAR